MDATITISKQELSAETLEYITDQNIFMYPLKLTFTSNVNFDDEANSDPNGKTIYPANVSIRTKGTRVLKLPLLQISMIYQPKIKFLK